jgi:hypothetical protein
MATAAEYARLMQLQLDAGQAGGGLPPPVAPGSPASVLQRAAALSAVLPAEFQASFAAWMQGAGRSAPPSVDPELAQAYDLTQYDEEIDEAPKEEEVTPEEFARRLDRLDSFGGYVHIPAPDRIMHLSGVSRRPPKPYKFIRFGDIHGPKPYKFIGFGDIHGPKSYKFIGFGDILGPKPCKFIGFGDIRGPKPCKFIRFGDIHGPPKCQLHRRCISASLTNVRKSCIYLVYLGDPPKVGTSRGHWGQIGANEGPISAPYWPLFVPIGLYWILLAPIGPYRPLWAPIGPYWLLWVRATNPTNLYCLQGPSYFLSGSFAILNSDFGVGFLQIFCQTWPQHISRATVLVLQCRLHRISTPQTNSNVISWQF